jgi:hypothetical protein
MKDITVIFLSMGILFLALSITIWKFKYLNIISGFNEEEIKDKEGFSKWFGKIMLYISIIAFSLGVLNQISESEKVVLFSLIIFMISTIILAAVALLGINKYR